MCGIVTAVAKYAGGFSAAALKAFEDLLYMDVLRGPDSTGVVLVDKFGAVTVAKAAVPAYWLMWEKDYDKKINDVAFKEGKILIGHNRKATVGKVTDKNAHPFIVKDELVLVHNGSLNAHKHLGEADVDSNAIAMYIHEHWKEDATPEVYAKMFQHIGGAFALVWYDLRFGKMYVVRNSQRPLFIAETHSEFFLASEKEMLLAGLSRNNLTAKTCVAIEANKLYTFDINEESSTFQTKVQEVAFPTIPFPVITPPKTKAGKVPHIPYKETVTALALRGMKNLLGSDGGAANDVLEDNEEISKSKFKRYVKQLEGKELNFTVEDFVETTKDSSYWFYGSCSDYGFNHDISGVCSNALTDEVIAGGMMATGKIVRVTYIKEERKVNLEVEISGSFVKQSMVIH